MSSKAERFAQQVADKAVEPFKIGGLVIGDTAIDGSLLLPPRTNKFTKQNALDLAQWLTDNFGESVDA